jgi:hypothetical protein
MKTVNWLVRSIFQFSLRVKHLCFIPLPVASVLDKLKRALSSLLAWLSVPTIVFFQPYVAPFLTNKLISVENQFVASRLGTAFGLIISLVVGPLLAQRSVPAKRWSALASLIISVILLSLCFYIWTLLSGALKPSYVEFLDNLQFAFFVLGTSLLCLTVTLTSLLIDEIIALITLTIIIIISFGFGGAFVYLLLSHSDR